MIVIMSIIEFRPRAVEPVSAPRFALRFALMRSISAASIWRCFSSLFSSAVAIAMLSLSCMPVEGV